MAERPQGGVDIQAASGRRRVLPVKIQEKSLQGGPALWQVLGRSEAGSGTLCGEGRGEVGRGREEALWAQALQPGRQCHLCASACAPENKGHSGTYQQLVCSTLSCTAQYMPALARRPVFAKEFLLCVLSE